MFVFARIHVFVQKVAAWVTGLPRWTQTKDLLNKVDWLSIYQLTIYHSLLLLWKIQDKREPVRNLKLLEGRELARIELTQRTLAIRARAIFLALDPSVRDVRNVSIFKNNIKKWIKQNIPIEGE